MIGTPTIVLVSASLVFFSSTAQSFVTKTSPPATRSLPFVSSLTPFSSKSSQLFYSHGSSVPKPQEKKDSDDEGVDDRSAKFQASDWNENARYIRQNRRDHRDDDDGRDRGDHPDWYEAAVRNNILRTDFRLFLTQRALQSFCFLCIECRDVHTVGWIEDQGNYTKLSEYHGLGAMVNTTWDGFFFDLMKSPEVEIVLEVKRRGPRRGSKNNPFLKDDFEEYIIPIDPTSLSSRVLSVREQISREMVKDLQAVKSNGDYMLDNYLASIKQNSERENLVFERIPTFHLDYIEDPNEDGGYLKSSPLRKPTFDLLTLLATQESVHRLLRDYKEAGSTAQPVYDWFKGFYFDRLETYFDGDGKHGRAHNFLSELLSTPPVAKRRNKMLSTIDPLEVAERILIIRAEVVDSWLEIAKEAGEEHTPIRRSLLNKQMGLL